MPIHDFKNIDDAFKEVDKGEAKEISNVDSIRLQEPQKKQIVVEPAKIAEKPKEAKKKLENTKEKPKKKKLKVSSPQIQGNLEIDEIEL
jgi:hypothetical protein